MNAKYIISSFLEACENTAFHGRWMTADRWADVIATQYKLPSDKAYNGIALNKAITGARWLTQAIDATGDVPFRMFNLYRNRYRPRNESASSRVWCYYAAPKGERPKVLDSSKAWFEEIDNGLDLLNKKLTRSTTLVFSDAHVALEEDQQTTKSSSNKRKRCSTTSPDTPSATAKKTVQNVEASYWESTEARKLFRPIAKERDALEGINNQIDLLCNATSTPNGYLALIDRREKTNNNEDDEDERFSDYQ